MENGGDEAREGNRQGRYYLRPRRRNNDEQEGAVQEPEPAGRRRRRNAPPPLRRRRREHQLPIRHPAPFIVEEERPVRRRRRNNAVNYPVVDRVAGLLHDLPRWHLPGLPNIPNLPVPALPPLPINLAGWPEDEDSSENSGSDDESSDEDSEDESGMSEGDETNSTTSSNENIPLFRVEEEDDAEDEGFNWHPFEPFGVNLDHVGDLHNFMDVFRRIAYGLNSTRTTIHVDTLPAPRPLDPERRDLLLGNLPPQGSIPMHRNFLVPPFTSAIVDSMPTQIQRRHIFITNYTRDCWMGLHEKTKQTELRALHSKIWCTVETANMIQKYYPLLYIEIQDLLQKLVPNRQYQILAEDEQDRLSVTALPLDTIPGSCMYLLSREGKYLLHTGSNAGQESFIASVSDIKAITQTIDIMYLDSALYFPANNSTVMKGLQTRQVSMDRIKWFMSHMAQKPDQDFFFSILYRSGMEKFVQDVVSWSESYNWRVGVTEDIYDWNYKEFLDYSETVVSVDHLDNRFLEPREGDRARIFFYTEENYDFEHVYSSNLNHIKLHVIYDYHSCLSTVSEGHIPSCGNTIYQKSLSYRSNQEDPDESKLHYYALYPSHPTTTQIKTLIRQLRPERIFGLSRAPGVGYTDLKDEFKKLCESSPRTRRQHRVEADWMG